METRLLNGAKRSTRTIRITFAKVTVAAFAAATASPPVPTVASRSTTASPAKQVDTIPGDDLRGVFITVTDQLFVGTLGGELTLYDLNGLEPIRTFGGSRGFMTQVHGTADGTLIATNGGDHSVILYDVASGAHRHTPITTADDESNRIARSLDGRWLSVGGKAADGSHATKIWHLDPVHWAARRMPRRRTQHDTRRVGLQHRRAGAIPGDVPRPTDGRLIATPPKGWLATPEPEVSSPRTRTSPSDTHAFAFPRADLATRALPAPPAVASAP